MAIAEIGPLAESPYIVLTCEFREQELAKQIPGSKFVNQAWRLPLTWAATQTFMAVFGGHAYFGPQLMAWYEEQQRKVNLQMALRTAPDVDLTGPTMERLRPLQRTGVAFMALEGRAVNGDEMGGGKTVQTIAALKLRQAIDVAVNCSPSGVVRRFNEVWGEDDLPAESWKGFPVLIVAPKKVKDSWRKHLEDWWPEATFAVAGDTLKSKREALEQITSGKAKVLIINWDALPKMSRLEPFGNITMTDAEKTPKELNQISWGTVVADEAHRIINRKSKFARALKAIANGTAAEGSIAAPYRFALTGTPVENNSADFWSLLNFIDPVSFPAYSKYVERFSTTSWNRWGALVIGGLHPMTRAEHDRIVLPKFIRRPRALLLPDIEVLPPTTHWVDMGTKQKKAYYDMALELITELEGGTLVATSAMHQKNRMMQLASAYGQMIDKGREVDGVHVLDLQLASPSCKVDALLELIEEAGADRYEGTQLVVGAESRQLIGLCERALDKLKMPYSLFVGGQTEAESIKAEEDFHEGRTTVALCTLAAASEGLNGLSVASTLVFLQRSWRSLLNDQFIGRVARPGQTKPVQVIDVMTTGTVEEWKALRLGEQSEMFEDVMADNALLIEMLKYKG